MPFTRATAAEDVRTLGSLDQRLAAIGFALAVDKAEGQYAQLEETLLDASTLGMDAGDLRILSMLCIWIQIHGTYVNVDRLTRRAQQATSAQVRVFWSAVAQWQRKDRR